ncbi:hypothetical protein BKA93DRAFT_818322 [Sparassis latifolia]
MPKSSKPPGLYTHSRQATSRSISISADGRRVVLRAKDLQICRSPSAFPEDSMEVDLPVPDSNPPDSALDRTQEPEPQPGLEGIHVSFQDDPMRTWIWYCDSYLDEVLHLEGRGLFMTFPCASCLSESPFYFRCKDCYSGEILCQTCMVSDHRCSPLHAIEVWTGAYFQKTSLLDLGLIVQLGHKLDAICSTHAEPRNITVLHTNGIYIVKVSFCTCTGSPEYQQLLYYSWWPATPLEPRTCASMHTLHLSQVLNLQGKITAYDFYKTLELLTDNTGLQKLPDRLPSFMLMIRQWRHVKMAKHAGRGHDSSGISESHAGALAPALLALSPRRIQPPSRRLYTLFISHDANFRLSNCVHARNQHDLWLAPGLAYFVHNEPYADYIKKFVDQEEIRTCVGFAALMNSLNQKAKGLRSTGVGGVSCSQHELFWPLGLGDLQKGERYCNMDYIFLSSVKSVDAKRLVVSYDIACQWSINFWARHEQVPLELQLQLPCSALEFYVPKFHLPPHRKLCHASYSFNFAKGCTRTDREGVECNWSALNPVAPSTKEMGPGARWETIDDVCGFRNWRKTVKLGNMLLCRMLEAIPEAVTHHKDFCKFTSGLLAQCPADISAWRTMLEKWEVDHSKPDPYALPESTVTLAEVRLKLVKEEQARVQAGQDAQSDVSPSAFLLLGMELEDQHRQRAALLKKILRFQEIRLAYMPFLPTFRQAGTAHAEAENIELTMPSSLPADLRARICVPGLAEMEDELWFAEATEALDDVRRQLRTRTVYNHSKIKNVKGQRLNTCTRAVQSGVDGCIHAATLHYRHSRSALLSLCELHDSDHAAMERNLAANFDSKWTVVRQHAQTILRDLNTAVQVLNSSLDAASEQDDDIESEAVDLDAEIDCDVELDVDLGLDEDLENDVDPV